MLVADLEAVLEKLAPRALAEPGDNCRSAGGRPAGGACGGVLVALELTEPVLAEAVAGGYDTILTHHPLLFSPLSSLVESRPRERMVRELVRRGINLIAAHTNLDSAEDGIGGHRGGGLGLAGRGAASPQPGRLVQVRGLRARRMPSEKVAAAVFAAGAGRIGDYEDCAFAAEGKGWFTPGPEAHPAVGQLSIPERAPEVRWETVVPREPAGGGHRRLHGGPSLRGAGLRRLCGGGRAHPHGPGAERRRLRRADDLADLAERVAELFELTSCTWSGDGARPVRRVAVLPGSGREPAWPTRPGYDVLITGDLGYHDAERAAEMGLAVDQTRRTVNWNGGACAAGSQTAARPHWREVG